MRPPNIKIPPQRIKNGFLNVWQHLTAILCVGFRKHEQP